MCLQTCVPNFEFLAWLEVCHELLHHYERLGGLWWFLTEDMEDMSHPWHFKCSSYMIPIWFPSGVPNLSYLAWLKVCQEQPPHHQWLGGHWGFLIKVMEKMGHPWPHYCSWHWIPSLCAKFNPSSMKRCAKIPPSSSVTLRTLRVPDQRKEDTGHLWPHNCSWHWILNLCAKIQHSSMIKSVSRTLCP